MLVLGRQAGNEDLNLVTNLQLLIGAVVLFADDGAAPDSVEYCDVGVLADSDDATQTRRMQEVFGQVRNVGAHQFDVGMGQGQIADRPAFLVNIDGLHGDVQRLADGETRVLGAVSQVLESNQSGVVHADFDAAELNPNPVRAAVHDFGLAEVADGNVAVLAEEDGILDVLGGART